MHRIIALVILLWGGVPAVAQQPFIRDFWLNDASLPVRVNAVLQDADGFIWLATEAGVYRFNGRETVHVPDVIHKPATALAFNGRRVVAGYADGTVGIIRADSVHRLPIRNFSPQTAISSMYADGSGTLWISTEGKGFYAVINNTAIACNTDKGLSDDYVYNLFPVPGKRIVASTDQGINEVYFDKGKLVVHTFTTVNGLPDNIVRTIQPMPDNTVCWVGTQAGGVAFYCRKTRKVWAPAMDTTWHWGAVNDILPIGRNRAWIATDDGYALEVYTPDMQHLQIRTIRHLEGRKINRLMLGRSGVIWMATNTGITMLADEYMQYLPLPRPYRIADIRAMVCDRANTLWYALGDKLYAVSLHARSAVPALQYTAPANITGLYADAQQRLWIGTFGKGLYCREANGKVTAISHIPSLQNETVLDVSGCDNQLWVAGLNGVAELECNNTPADAKLLRIHNKESGAGSDYIYQVYPDSKGRVWMATDGGGISMYAGGKFTNWGAADSSLPKVIYGVTEDAIGRIWVNTLGDGLYCYNGKQWQHLSLAQGLQDVNVHTIAANNSGQLVAVHNTGIDVWYPASGQFRNYNYRKGFSIDTTSSVLKLSARDVSGNVYIPFEQGLLIFKNINAAYDIRPRVHIDGLSVFFRPVPIGRNTFNHSQNHISFRYEGINFANPDKLHYRYTLDGYSNSWIVTNDESATFPQLSPGTYTFRVQASLNNVFSKSNEVRYTFTITRPFWQALWFIGLVAALIIGLIYAYIRAREKSLRRLSSLQRERLLFEYEHLKSQVNPHFLFNSLNTLANLIEEDRDAAVQYTNELSDLYRNMLTYRNKDLVPLAEEWNILQHYLYIQQSRFGDALQVELRVPETIMNTRRIVPLALQLLVENAIKHNVASRSRPLTIIIEAQGDRLAVRNAINPKLSKEKGAGLGLINIKKRYALITDRHISFGVVHNEYIVTLPLL